MKKRFSDRIGITQLPPALQLMGMTDALRNRIWNAIVADPLSYRAQGITTDWLKFSEPIADQFMKVPYNQIPSGISNQLKWIREYFYGLDWFEVYNLVEFLVENYRSVSEYFSPDKFIKSLNCIFEEEDAGYRIKGVLVVPMTNETELRSIDETLSTGTVSAGAKIHFETALTCFSKKPDPDYRNCIKEAISAVESLVTNLADEKDFSRALRNLREGLALHPALVGAIDKLYGYTSDEDGVRHGIFGDREVGFDEAKLMLVTCSALINYLITKSKT